MALLNATYSSLDGGDLHLVPGMLSPRLDQRLFLTYTGNVETRADKRGDSTALTFEAVLASAPANHGIDFNPDIGQISMHPGTPRAAGLRSFLVKANIVDGATSFTLKVRVHVHDAIAATWLAPKPLTIRHGGQNMRLSLLARFTDGVVADVTNWGATRAPEAGDLNFARIAAGGGTQPWLRWSGPAAGAQVSVDPQTGLLSATSDAGLGDITAEVGPPAAAFRDTAEVRSREPWNANVELQPLSPNTTFASIGTRMNVLILPDGFTGPERGDFELVAQRMVDLLENNDLTRPFDLFPGRVNYFMAWVESRQKGISVLNETHHGVPATEGLEIPVAVPDPGRGDPWTISNLIDEVGLPAPIGDPGTPIGTAVANWQARFGLHITEDRLRNGIGDDGKTRNIYDDWLALTDRVLVDDVDTAFHLGFGSRPSVTGQLVNRAVSVNPRRHWSADFEDFLKALCLPRADPADPVVTPNRWSFGQPDQGNVVILARSQRTGGLNPRRLDSAGNQTDAHLIGLSLGVHGYHLLDNSPTGTVRLRADAIPPGDPSIAWLRTAHELAHSWSLLDEYKGPFTLDVMRSAITGAANVQTRDELLVGGHLGSAAIKWRWPRIAACGILATPPTRIDATHFRLVLRRGHAFGVGPEAPAFQVDHIVRLRTRPLVGSKQSDRARVTDVNPATDTVTVELLAPDGGERDLTTFATPAGQESIVMRLHMDAGRELLMVSQRVLDRIDATHNPLNALAGAGADRAWDTKIDPSTPTRARNFTPAAPHPPRYSSWIVGLYEDGAQVDVGVYRPTGVCLLRQLFINRVVAGGLNTNKEQAYQFCPVCRYVMVDTIDPTKHGQIDRNYERRYVR